MVEYKGEKGDKGDDGIGINGLDGKFKRVKIIMKDK